LHIDAASNDFGICVPEFPVYVPASYPRQSLRVNNPTKIMRVENTISFPGNGIALSNTLVQVNEEMFNLLSRQNEINQRIRSLHKLIRGLRFLAGSDVPDRNETERSAVVSSKVHRDLQFKQQVNSARQMARHRFRPTPRKDALSRACRIALLEAGGIASLEEIQLRITRRGSFSFINSSFASASLIRTLNTMARAGEVCCQGDGSQSKWRRMAPENYR
jgi:hypothetical protein